MSALPRELARRIDRLARHAHAFHRFAHHPLCDAYAHEVWRLGRVRVCRGCTLATAGSLCGAGAGVFLPRPLLAAGATGLVFALSLVVALGRRRLPKGLTRFLPSLLATSSVVAGVRAGGLGIAVALAVAVTFSAALAAYRRRGPSREPCRVCPEYGLAQACSGLRPIVRREKAFQRLSGQWIAQSLPSAEGLRNQTDRTDSTDRSDRSDAGG